MDIYQRYAKQLLRCLLTILLVGTAQLYALAQGGGGGGTAPANPNPQQADFTTTEFEAKLAVSQKFECNGVRKVAFSRDATKNGQTMWVRLYVWKGANSTHATLKTGSTFKLQYQVNGGGFQDIQPTEDQTFLTDINTANSYKDVTNHTDWQYLEYQVKSTDAIKATSDGGEPISYTLSTTSNVFYLAIAYTNGTNPPTNTPPNNTKWNFPDQQAFKAGGTDAFGMYKLDHIWGFGSTPGPRPAANRLKLNPKIRIKYASVVTPRPPYQFLEAKEPTNGNDWQTDKVLKPKIDKIECDTTFTPPLVNPGDRPQTDEVKAELNICTGDQLELDASLFTRDFFNYQWTGVGFVDDKNQELTPDSSFVTTEKITSNQTLTVMRYGFCDLQPKLTVDIKVQKRPTLKLEGPDQICAKIVRTKDANGNDVTEKETEYEVKVTPDPAATAPQKYKVKWYESYDQGKTYSDEEIKKLFIDNVETPNLICKDNSKRWPELPDKQSTHKLQGVGLSNSHAFLNGEKAIRLLASVQYGDCYFSQTKSLKVYDAFDVPTSKDWSIEQVTKDANGNEVKKAFIVTPDPNPGTDPSDKYNLTLDGKDYLCAPATLRFENKSSGTAANATAEWSYTTGKNTVPTQLGAQTTLENTFHNNDYATNPGEHTIFYKLRWIGTDQCDVNAQFKVNVRALPNPAPAVTHQDFCSPETLSVKDLNKAQYKDSDNKGQKTTWTWSVEGWQKDFNTQQVTPKQELAPDKTTAPADPDKDLQNVNITHVDKDHWSQLKLVVHDGFCEASKELKLDIKPVVKGELKLDAKDAECANPLSVTLTGSKINGMKRYQFSYEYQPDAVTNPTFWTTVSEPEGTRDPIVQDDQVNHTFTIRNIKDTKQNYKMHLTLRPEDPQFMCELDLSQEIEVGPTVTADFIANQQELCANTKDEFILTVDDKAIKPGKPTDKWVFKHDGAGATEQEITPTTPDPANPTKLSFTVPNVPTTTQTYTLTRTITSTWKDKDNKDRTCTATATAQIKVKPSPKPKIHSYRKENGKDVEWKNTESFCAPIEATFSATDILANPPAAGGGINYQIMWRITKNGVGQGDNNTEKFTYNFTNRTGKQEKYTVKLEATNDGCIAEDTKEFYVNPSVSPVLDIRYVDVCNPVKVELDPSKSLGGSDGKNAGLTYTIEDTQLEPAGGGAVQNPSPDIAKGGALQTTPNPFNTAGKHTITVKVENTFQDATKNNQDGHCSANVTGEIMVPEKVVADFTMDPTLTPKNAGCSPLALKFNSTSTGTESVLWKISANGNLAQTATSTDYDYTFTNQDPDKPLKYTVELIATTKTCTNTKTEEILVYPGGDAIPQVEFPNGLCGEQTGQLEVRVSAAKCAYENFTWTFTPKTPNPTGVPTVTETTSKQAAKNRKIPDNERDKAQPASYTDDLEYELTLSATKTWPNGPTCKIDNQKVRDILVPARLDVPFEPTTTSYCTPAKVAIATKQQGKDLKHDLSPTIGGQAMQTVDQTAPANFTFENTTTQELQIPVDIRTYRTIPTGEECSFTRKLNVTVHAPVSARFMYEVPQGQGCTMPITGSFKQQSSYSTSTTATNEVKWKFGDGQEETQNQNIPNGITHQYTNNQANTPETKTVEMTFIQKYNNDGVGSVCQDTYKDDIVVQPGLKVDFDMTPTELCSDNEVTFTNKTTGGDNLEYHWDFGNNLGTDKTREPGKRIYTNASQTPITVPVVLSVTRPEDGCNAPVTKQLTVYPRVEAKFNFKNATTACWPADLEIENGSSAGGTGNAITYTFDLLNAPATQQVVTNNVQDPVVFKQVSNKAADAKTYKVKLVAKSQLGCSGEFEREFIVNPDLTLNLTADKDPLEGCNPQKVTFTANTTGTKPNNGITWSYDGLTKTDQNTLTHDFVNPLDQADKKFPVTVTVRGLTPGCERTVSKEVTVYPKLDATISVDKDKGCSPLDVTITNERTGGAYTYAWDFGNGTNSTQVQPGTITYTNATNPPQTQNFDIKLTVSYTGPQETCTKEVKQSISVFPPVIPVLAPFAAGCSPLTISPINQTVVEPGKVFYELKVNGIAYNDPQQKVTLTNPSEENQDKEFEIELKATSERGCSATYKDKVTVWALPKPIIEVQTANGLPEGCPPLDVTFNNLTKGTDQTFFFELGDGTTETKTDNSPVTRTYTNNTSTPGGPGVPATFVNSTYSIKLTATSQHNCKAETATSIVVFPPVSAMFTQSADKGCSPLIVDFTTVSSNASDFTWDFGDGRTSKAANPKHNFVNTQTTDQPFTIKLTATSPDGCSDTKQDGAVTVYATPRVDFDINPPLEVFAEPGVDVTFTNRTTPLANNWTYEWDFGDGITDNQPAPAPHTYTRWGDPANWYKFPVKLKVKAPNCEDEMDKHVIILPPTPTTSFTAASFTGCAPFIVYFENQTLYAEEYTWDFNDGSPVVSDQEPFHRFDKPGIYNVCLKAKGEGGAKDYFQVVEVHPNPTARFDIQPGDSTPVQVMLPDARVTFINRTFVDSTLSTQDLPDGFKYLWDFGDSQTSDLMNPVHIYDRAGEYNVRLNVESEFGCTHDTLVKSAVIVLPAANIAFPNIFTPMTSGYNDGYWLDGDYNSYIFRPVCQPLDNDYVIKKFKLIIFNRWGQQIFESNEYRRGWDGLYLGKPAPTGVYIYRATGIYMNGIQFDVRGNVTLLR